MVPHAALQLRWVDFDIEGGAVAETESVDRRNQALAKLQVPSQRGGAAWRGGLLLAVHAICCYWWTCAPPVSPACLQPEPAVVGALQS